MKINCNNVLSARIPSFKSTKEGISLSNPLEESTKEQKKQKVYASNVCFKGGPQLTKLVNDYKWFINTDKLSAIDSFLKIEGSKESLESLLRFILNDEKLSIQFFDSISEQIRSNAGFYKAMRNKLPECSEVLNTSHPLSVYFKSYSKYLDSRYENAQSVSELLKMRPDWSEQSLLQKHRELYKNDSFELGFVPDSIGRENFMPLIDYLRQHSQFGFKMHKNIPDLVTNGRTFKITALIDGKSDKNVFDVEAENGKKYIVKLANPGNRSLDDAFSLGTLAKIDTYLTRNNCRNSAPIRYYNHDTNTAIYDYINHSKVLRTHDVSNSGKKIPDFVDLGMRQNDTVGLNNYFQLDASQTALKNTYDFKYGVEHEELVSVDNDHATYMNILAPIIKKYHNDLPNAMLGMFF